MIVNVLIIRFNVQKRNLSFKVNHHFWASTCVVVSVSSEPHPLPVFWCFDCLRMFPCGEWVCFPQPMTACRWGWEDRNLMPFRPEKSLGIAAKKRKYSPSEAACQADKTRFRTRVNLSLALSRFGALKERLEMKSDVELLLSVGQVGAKHRRLTCASSLSFGLFYWNKYNIPT